MYNKFCKNLECADRSVYYTSRRQPDLLPVEYPMKVDNITAQWYSHFEK